jgi:Domain of Unknown Function with PDB structure (DUF3857)/Transglutaminase-like superfamily
MRWKMIIGGFGTATRREGPMPSSNLRMRVLSLALLASVACIAPPFAAAGLAQTPAAQPSPDGAPFTVAFDSTIKLNADKTAEYVESRRVKVLGIAALQQVAQQNIEYVEGMQSFEIVSAFTEKANGTTVAVDLTTVITRDVATGLGAVFLRDLKVVTVIFPDVAVGDTLVLTSRKTIYSDTFAGHFEMMIPLPRNISRADSTVRVTAPSSLPLQVGVQGEGMQHIATTNGTETQHLITYRGRPPLPPEDRMTSPLDRDPSISISTFASYEELARSYWDTARDAIEVTPEIARLADEITRGINDKRAQARAISAWVKTNVRYVFVVLGATRVVPHSAAVVLKNRYGDCKDHAVLMSALLAAKEIGVEHVLINGQNSYTLPEPATMGHLNHVILYLPEFGIYDDPTVQFASFGVLAGEEYDKPVVHVSDRRVYRARTPAMKSEDHLSIRRTRLSVATDGTVSGETEQFGTGLFALNVRAVSASLQATGLEQSAEEYLRRANAPGKGRFEIGSLTDLSDSHSTRARFAYDARMIIKPSMNFAIPIGLGIQARPGDYVLGPLLPGRKLPFTCLAATQVEQIELIFAEGVPLPQKIDDRRIETKSFVYTAEYRLENRSLKVRREFVSRVPGQVCAAEVEAEIAQPLRDVFASNATRMAFPAQPAAQPARSPTVPAAQPPISQTALEALEIKRTAVVDQPLRVDFLYSINPDCSSVGVTAVRTLEEPKHGKLTVGKGAGFTSFPKDNPREACNRRRSEGMLMYYRPEAGYLGPDFLTVDVIYGNGASRKRHYVIGVNPKPAPLERSGAAAAGQQTRVGFLTNIDPDCSSTGFASVRVVEEPTHGAAILKDDTGFTNFAKDNSRFECNKQRSDGTAVLYRGEEAYTGKDSVTVEIVYVDGRETSVHYSIDVK